MKRPAQFRRQPIRPAPVACLLAILHLGSAGMGVAQNQFETPVSVADIDPAATADWGGGVLRTNPQFHPNPTDNRVLEVLSTRTTRSGAGWPYGTSTQAGPHHVRIGLNRSVPVGTIVATGDSQVSVLRSGATYPGDLTNETDWLPAQRIEFRQVATNFPDANAVSTWVLPPGTSTRALRFSHTSNPSDPLYQGKVTGAWLLTERFANIGPQAIPLPVANLARAPVLVNYKTELFSLSWENGPQGGSNVVSATFPEAILLVWPTNVTLRGLCALSAGFSEGEIWRYTGPTDRHPREALASDWTLVSVHTNIQTHLPRAFTPNWLDFGAAVTTRALRLLITKASLADPYQNTAGGKRVSLGEVMAFMPLGTATLESSILPPPAELHPPIPIPLTLGAAGLVSLVIEDANGKRVRNLIAETPFPAGQHTVWWDGLDESGRISTGSHGNYEVQGNLVAAGIYSARGLVRDPVKLRYRFSVGTAGNPPWKTGRTGPGGWLADHRPPCDVILLPGTNAQMLIGSEICEAGDGLVWTDLEGRKRKGRGALAPGGFYAASHLAYDAGPSAVSNLMACSGVSAKKQILFFGLSIPNGDPITLPSLTFPSPDLAILSGLAVRNGLLCASLGATDQIVTVDVRTKTILATNSLVKPRGLAFDNVGRLLVLAGDRLYRATVNFVSGRLENLTPLIVDGLDDPRRLAVDPAGRIYVSLWGNSHQVLVFDAAGGMIRRIGRAGSPAAGPYDPQQMHHPLGMAITPDNRLWVAEYDSAPKRISVWTTEGTLVRTFEGPPKYGGGGRLDPQDPTRFYYGDSDADEPVPYFIGLEYRLDWTTGSNWLAHVFYRKGTNEFHLPSAGPETAIYLNGRQYMVNAHNSNPVAGAGVAGIWQMRNALAVPVAAAGSSAQWTWLTRPEFSARLPAGVSLNSTVFVWSDLNDDAVAQAEEVSFQSQPAASFLVTRELAFLSGRAWRLRPRGFTALGAPIYHLADAQTVVPGVVPLGSSGGGQMLEATNGSFVLTGGPMTGYRNGQVAWTYPSQWPSLHASHSAPTPSSPGQMIGTTRLLGGMVTPKSGEAGEVWAVNGNLGNLYLMTADGLFLATLFRDIRTAPAWSMAQNTRDIDVNEVSLLDECFWPAITQVTNGEIYLTVGKNHSALVRVDGLESVRRLPTIPVSVTSQHLLDATAFLARREAERVASAGRDTLEITTLPSPPRIDGQLNEWANVQWARIDDRTSAAIALGQGCLYAAFKTGDSALLSNSATSAELLFKTGGGLDLMVGTASPDADPARPAPVIGDFRLLTSRTLEGLRATLYRPVYPSGADPVTFSSPIRTVVFDRVDDISAWVTVAGTNQGDFELAVSLAVLNFNPAPGQILLADVGILRGSAGQTMQRVYWHNKSTTLVSDIPSEAELLPRLWGRWYFRPPPARPGPPANLRIQTFGP
jgi:hypothetical protein